MNKKEQEAFQDYIQWLAETYNIYLSAYLTNTVQVENLMENYISGCFVEYADVKKTETFKDTVLSRLNYWSKENVFKSLVKKERPFSAKEVTLLDNLATITHTRNQIAHSKPFFPLPSKGIPKKDRIVYINGGKKLHTLTAQCNKDMQELYEIQNWIAELINEQITAPKKVIKGRRP